jgi:hypothetical protein
VIRSEFDWAAVKIKGYEFRTRGTLQMTAPGYRMFVGVRQSCATLPVPLAGSR